MLCRDVIVDDAQIYLAREYGADAISFIVSVAPAQSLRTWVEIARSMHMDSVLECANETELELACAIEHALIAVRARGRSRDETLDLARRIPPERIAILADLAEPTLTDVERFRGVVDAWIVEGSPECDFSALAEAGES